MNRHTFPHRLLPVLALASGMAFAQEPGKCPPHSDQPDCLQAQQERRGQKDQKAPPEKNQADRGPRANQNIENYLKYLKEARAEQIKLRLGVSSKKASEIATKWAEMEIPIRSIHTESMAVWRQMQFIIQEASPEGEKSRKIKPLNDRYNDLHRQLAEARQNLFRELPMMGDTPIQQTRILFLMEEMERRERDGLRAFIEKRDRRSE
ncbi:MAG: hypothetical protein FWG12_05465 [Holophagaceae bacterium]|nr:hypothetical protein [Holophagaceae bacterium]